MIDRYQTAAMAALFTDEAVMTRWLQVELAVCAAWHRRGAIDDADMATLRARGHFGSVAQVRAREEVTRHDLVAFVQAVAAQVGPAGRHVHRGLTSSDVVDSALAIGLVAALDLILAALDQLRRTLASLAQAHRRTFCVGRTHGVHAEPTTFGLRLAGWCCELSRHRTRLLAAQRGIGFGKLSGAVGTFSQLAPDFEAEVMATLNLQPEPVATQVVPRDRHAELIQALAGLGAGIERFATEIRHLQRTEVREVEEGFAAGQTGSSAMPHKRNPIACERLCGLARLLRGYVQPALENVALWHDRDISHSSVERVILPDACHLSHHLLLSFDQVMAGLRIYPDRMRQNLAASRGLAFSQGVLGLLLQAGLDRRDAYALVQTAAAQIWEGESTDLQAALAAQPAVMAHLTPSALATAFDLNQYTQHLDAVMARARLDLQE